LSMLKMSSIVTPIMSGFKGIQRILGLTILLVLLNSVGSGCKEDGANVPEAPVIEFLDYQVYKNTNDQDSLLRVRFYFEDKDGDLGLDRTDTFPPFDPGSPYQFNLWVDMFDLDGSVPKILTREGTDDTLNLDQRIPNITPSGNNKEISGEMSIDFDASELVLHPNKVSCDLQVVDRALNESNVISTGPIELVH